MTTANASTQSLGDRYAEVAVLVLTAIALLLGWTLMNNVESRAVKFEQNGLTAFVPAGWRTSQGDGDVLVSAADLTSGGFATTYMVRALPVAKDASLKDTASLLTLNDGQTYTAYRVLDSQPVTINGREAYKVTYAYVESNPDMTHADLPTVVRGVDYIFLSGGKAIVVSYHASEDNFTSDFARFRQFVLSLTF
jgi:hypothetical protein